MQLIRTITENDLGRESDSTRWASFSDRIAVRAVIVNDDDQVALMHVANKGYYKLPGGGVDPGESLEDALKRELKEEAGVVSFQVIIEVGEIHEYREHYNKHSKHLCYLVKLTGPLEATSQTDKEITQGYQLFWANNIDEAIDKVESGNPQEYGQDFERLREFTFLQYIKSSKFVHEGRP